MTSANHKAGYSTLKDIHYVSISTKSKLVITVITNTRSIVRKNVIIANFWQLSLWKLTFRTKSPISRANTLLGDWFRRENSTDLNFLKPPNGYLDTLKSHRIRLITFSYTPRALPNYSPFSFSPD